MGAYNYLQEKGKRQMEVGGFLLCKFYKCSIAPHFCIKIEENYGLICVNNDWMKLNSLKGINFHNYTFLTIGILKDCFKSPPL